MRNVRMPSVVIRIKYDAAPLTAINNTIKVILDNPAYTRQLLKRAVMKSIVRKMRARFLRRAEVALEMETIKQRRPGDDPLSDGGRKPKKRALNTKLKAELEAEMDSLIEAQFGGADDRAEALRTRIAHLGALVLNVQERQQRQSTLNSEDQHEDKYGRPRRKRDRNAHFEKDPFQEIIANALEERNHAQADLNRTLDTKSINQRIQDLQQRLSDAQGFDEDGRKIKPHYLSSIRGAGMFRSNMNRLLNLLTDSSLAEVFETRSGIGIGIGKLSVIETVRTPSSTQALTGVATTSRRQTFWRHLEFGTGVYRKRLGNAGDVAGRNSALGHQDAWYYGDGKKGIVAKGTQAMNFITTNQNQMYPDDAVALQEAITEMMDALFRKK